MNDERQKREASQTEASKNQQSLIDSIRAVEIETNKRISE